MTEHDGKENLIYCWKDLETKLEERLTDRRVLEAVYLLITENICEKMIFN